MTQQDDTFRDDTPFSSEDRLAGEGSTDVDSPMGSTDADSPMGDGSDTEEKAVGGGAGAVGGAAIGTAVGGPVGTVAGAVIGGVAGAVAGDKAEDAADDDTNTGADATDTGGTSADRTW